MKKKLITYTKISLVLVLSYFIADVINEGLFRNDSPRFQADIPQRAREGLQMTWDQTSYVVASLLNREAGISPHEQERIVREIETAEDNELNDVEYQPIIRGVSAKEVDELEYVVVRDDEVAWKEYTVTIDGEQLKIKVPAEQELPPPQILQ